jgi:hypothetical protein
VLQDISTFTFPQLIEMEEKTCTVVVSRPQADHRGMLFFAGGVLLDALCDGIRGKKAACIIFSWDKVNIAIHNACPCTERFIRSSTATLLLEGMRLRDECTLSPQPSRAEYMGLSSADSTGPQLPHGAAAGALAPHRPILNEEELRARRLRHVLGKKRGIEDVYRDSSWNDALDIASDLGVFFKSGDIKLCYVSGVEDGSDLILLPADPAIAIAVDKRSLRENMIETVLASLQE